MIHERLAWLTERSWWRRLWPAGRSGWLRLWPAWTDAVFLLLAVVRLLPGGYLRAALALPIVLMVPGSLTLGAVFGRCRRPQAPVLVASAALLGVIWLVVVFLVLSAAGVQITAVHAFWGLFAASTLIAAIAQARILSEPASAGERAGQATSASAAGPDGDATLSRARQRRAAYYSAGAIAVGLGLLVAGVYTWDHIGHPAPVGYTAIAWTGVRDDGVVAIGRGGADLTFEIVHRQPDAAAYSLEAGFVGRPSRLIAGPLRIKVAPDKTVTGRLHVPAFNSGCTYRLTVTLTALPSAAAQVGARSWSLNLNVYGLGQPQRGCG